MWFLTVNSFRGNLSWDLGVSSASTGRMYVCFFQLPGVTTNFKINYPFEVFRKTNWIYSANILIVSGYTISAKISCWLLCGCFFSPSPFPNSPFQWECRHSGIYLYRSFLLDIHLRTESILCLLSSVAIRIEAQGHQTWVLKWCQSSLPSLDSYLIFFPLRILLIYLT